MTKNPARSSIRVLDPINRVSEILFVLGFRLAHYMGGRPWLMGACMVVVGAALVALAIALGG